MSIEEIKKKDNFRIVNTCSNCLYIEWMRNSYCKKHFEPGNPESYMTRVEENNICDQWETVDVDTQEE